MYLFWAARFVFPKKNIFVENMVSCFLFPKCFQMYIHFSGLLYSTSVPAGCNKFNCRYFKNCAQESYLRRTFRPKRTALWRYFLPPYGRYYVYVHDTFALIHAGPGGGVWIPLWLWFYADSCRFWHNCSYIFPHMGKFQTQVPRGQVTRSRQVTSLQKVHSTCIDKRNTMLEK